MKSLVEIGDIVGVKADDIADACKPAEKNPILGIEFDPSGIAFIAMTFMVQFPAPASTAANLRSDTAWLLFQDAVDERKPTGLPSQTGRASRYPLRYYNRRPANVPRHQTTRWWLNPARGKQLPESCGAYCSSPNPATASRKCKRTDYGSIMIHRPVKSVAKRSVGNSTSS
jgi:hypothetical protein